MELIGWETKPNFHLIPQQNNLSSIKLTRIQTTLLPHKNRKGHKDFTQRTQSFYFKASASLSLESTHI